MSFSKKQKFTPTPEQAKLLEDYNIYLKACESSANEPAWCDAQNNNATQNLQRKEEELLATGFPREELPDVKQAKKQEKIDRIINAPGDFLFFDLPDLCVKAAKVCKEKSELAYKALCKRMLER